MQNEIEEMFQLLRADENYRPSDCGLMIKLLMLINRVHKRLEIIEKIISETNYPNVIIDLKNVNR